MTSEELDAIEAHAMSLGFALLEDAVELVAEIRRLHEEGAKDYDGMRDMQAKFMAADHELRELKRLAAQAVCGHRRTGEALKGRIYQCPDCFATWRMGEHPP